MNLKTIAWKNKAIKIIDQTRLPGKLKYIYLKDLKALRLAIKNMCIRGAPALGAAAGLGVYLGIKDSKAENFTQFKKELERIIGYLWFSRPTARNLFAALERIHRVALENKKETPGRIKRLIFAEVRKIIEEDRKACRRLAGFGAGLLKSGDTILTICNAGMLATIDYGTALGVIYRAKEEAKTIKVFACETRPLLQGARLTAWELKRKGIDATLICDDTAATLMQQGKIDKVITGADRIAANADTANKIGTCGLAVLSHYHKIPFYIAAPISTFDLKIKTGKDIPIEERKPQEITGLFFKRPVAQRSVGIFNPAFDVTPHNLITAIITDKGIIKPPYQRNILRISDR